MARPRRVLAAWALLASACTDTAPAAAPQAFAADVFFDEDFPVAQGRCRVVAAEELLTELDAGSGAGRVGRDVRVLRVQLGCVASSGLKLAPSLALAPDVALTLVHPGATSPLTPLLRTKLSQAGRDDYVFAVPRSVAGAQPVRRYSTDDGAPSGPALVRATLVLSNGVRAQRVHLQRRFETEELYARLDRFASELSAPRAVLPEDSPLAGLHRRIMTIYAPRTLTLTVLAVTAEQAWLRLAYEGITRLLSEPRPLLLELRLATRGASLTPSVVTEQLASLTRRVACAEETSSLRARSATHAQTAGPCNVAGVLVEAACGELEPELIRTLVEHGERCAEPALVSAAARLPEDFQLTLRKGRGASALDREPRFTLSLFANGAVVFHGTHWVSSRERRDGRTGARFLTELWSKTLELDFFERRGGEWDPESCSPALDEGNLLTVHGAGRERMVVDRRGCRGPFSAAEIRALIELAERAAFVVAWTTPRAPDRDPEAQVWDVTVE